MAGNQIVTLNVTQTLGATPNTLQKTGLIISQGGTNTPVNTISLLTQASDLTAILPTPLTILTLVWGTGTVTVTTAAAHGFTNGTSFAATIAGAVPSAYNGTYIVTVTGTSTLTYALAANPGTMTTPGTIQKVSVLPDITTFFAQGASESIYVLELGEGTAAAGVTALTTFLALNPLKYYTLKVPNGWDAEPTFATFAGNNSATTSEIYFFVTCTLATYTNFATATPHKSIVMMIQAATAPATESSIMSYLWQVVHQSPSNVNQVAPMAFRYLVGVTAYVPTPTQATLFKNAGLNYVDTGAEGGISKTILKWGMTADKNDFNYWYSVDWVQTNLHLDFANTIINGSNNPQAPLYYNQRGINQLQTVAQGTVNRGSTFGMVVGAPVVAAIPFAIYVASNPSDYPAGIYNGLSLTFTPARGFTSITFNLNVSQLAL